jgi:hypothetical protein
MKYENNNKFREVKTVDKRKISSERIGTVSVSLWQFKKVICNKNKQGETTSEFPIENNALLIKKGPSTMWLNSFEIKSLRELIESAENVAFDRLAAS